MITAVLLQWILKDYLFYGFAQALGVLVLYLSNHNYNDLVDLRTDLYNRRTALEHLKDIRTSGQHVSLIGVAVFDQQFLSQNVSVSDLNAYTDAFAGYLTKFLYKQFGIQNTFCIETNIYLVTVKKEECEETVRKISDRFLDLWKIKEKEFYFVPGIAQLDFPDEVEMINQAFDLITDGVRNSSDNKGKIMHLDDIIDDKERRINSLEKIQEQLEKQYIETEDKMNKAVIADRSKSMFLAQMSHEIRTPMTAILGMTELLLRDSKDKTITGYANAIMNSGRNLLGIINDILDFSKIESGKMTIVKEKYMITSVMYDLVVGILHRVSEKKLNLRVRFDPSIPMYLLGDEIRVKQLMFNILTNACKYTQKGEIIFDVRCRKEGSICNLIIKISDTGIGIRKENLSRIFERFERFEPEINKSIEGTGLGLAIVRQLIELMEGSIRVESEYGVGSTFTVTLPQEIIEDSPSVLLDSNDRRRIAYCFENVSLEEDMREACDSLKIESSCFACSDDLDILIGDETYTNIFVCSGILRRLVASQNKLIFDRRLTCIFEYGEILDDYAGRIIKTPISSINLGAFCNGTLIEPLQNFINEKNYTAPTAKILCVDDNAVNLKIFKSLCEPHEFIIDCVESGDECIERTRINDYDIIFLDHMMPQKDGIDTIHEILSTEDNKCKDKPFVAFTANAISGMKEMFINEGFTDFLSKPIDPSKLEEMLFRYIPKDKMIIRLADDNEEGDDNTEERMIKNLKEAGLDTESALEYAGGSADTLREVLDVFISDGKEKIELMKDQLKEGNYADFTTQIHAVKSLTKGLGLPDLSQKALELELAGKGGNYSIIDDKGPDVLKEYGEIIDIIYKAIN